MTTELKPCPFCGGEAQVGWTDFDSGVIFVGCETCGMYCEPKDCYANEQKAIEAWNTRAKRTCHMTYNEEWSGDEYYPTQAYTCSRCGWITEMGVPRYCPSCGAKVVDE